MGKIRVTVWNEYWHEPADEAIGKIYPKGIHGAIAEALEQEADFEVRTAVMKDPENGLPQEVIDNTDVLIWWGHMAHHLVEDEVAARVQEAVVSRGMGFIPLHSAHFSKPFIRLMGTTCAVTWREDALKERVWIVNTAHPIVKGLEGYCFEVPATEMYGEPFDIPQPDEQVFVNWYPGGEVFRGGCCFKRGLGKIFYFSPGHETFPIYYQPEIRLVIKNAVRWAAPMANITPHPGCVWVAPREAIEQK